MDNSYTSEHKRLLVVLGMHRSGTSAISRGLQVMGVQLGDRLMPVDEGNNDKGFWEDIDINALNVEMLNAIHNDWHHLSLITSVELEWLKSNGYFARATELMQHKTCNIPIFGFKDPRVSKLLPFWQEVFSYCQFDVNYILAIRHPISVALSLAHRNGIDMEKSHLLWLIHVIKSLSGILGLSYIVLDYDKLMLNPEAELLRVARKFHLTINLTELAQYQSGFLDQNLRHTVFNHEDLMHHDRTSDLLREVFTTVLNLSNDQHLSENELRNHIQKWEAELEIMKLSFVMADKAYMQIDAVHQQLAAKEALISQCEQEKLHILSESQRTTDGLSSQIAQLLQQLSEKDSRILQEQVNMDKLLTSRSWQITKPLRYISKLLRNRKSVQE
ncbi:MAG: hypothetical protein WCH34_01765 [Bacteroidota bacterium]